MAPGFSGEPDLGDLGDSHGYAGTAGGARWGEASQDAAGLGHCRRTAGAQKGPGQRCLEGAGQRTIPWMPLVSIPLVDDVSKGVMFYNFVGLLS